MLTIFRRHTPACPHGHKGRAHIKCTCPLWADGYVDGKRVFLQSLKTRDMARARKKVASLEDPDQHPDKPIHEAIAAFLAHCTSAGLEESTFRKYKNSLTKLRAFCESKGHDSVDEITIDVLDAFRASRGLAAITAVKELQLLRQFCSFCTARHWMTGNPAKEIRAPKNLSPNDVVPYTPGEVTALIHACDLIGQNSYERLRARAMVLTLRYTALRIGDVALLARDRISRDGNHWRVFLHTEKNGKPVFLPIPAELKAALDCLPLPKGTRGESKHFFWNGTSKPRSMKKSADDTLRSVYKKSGIKGAHAHRFRHTLATELLGRGASFEDIADILGNTPDVVRQHYAKWSPARQSRIDDLMSLVHGDVSYTSQHTSGRVN
jgi:integrase/recombinase XerC